MPSRTFAIFGGTFDPPHNGHRAAVEWLSTQVDFVAVVPSIGHEFKTSATHYFHRRAMVELVWPSGFESHARQVVLLEETVVAAVGLPVMALDMLRELEVQCGSPLTGPDPDLRFVFAIGPDIDPTTWTGYQEIIDEGFDFIRVLDLGHPRSTDIRGRIAEGREWESFVAPEVAAYIRRHGLYGLPRPPRVWKGKP